jgi:hypothetical protein
MDLIGILRQYRIGPFTIFDTAIAYIAVFLLAPLLTKIFTKIHVYISKTGWLWLTLPISVIFHFFLHQNTPFMKMFLDPHNYVVKIIILFMLYMGIRNAGKPKPIKDLSKS